jgi:hypothetical protein
MGVIGSLDLGRTIVFAPRGLERIDVELPGVGEDGMPGRNGHRKPGTARGSPRRSRTACS